MRRVLLTAGLAGLLFPASAGALCRQRGDRVVARAPGAMVTVVRGRQSRRAGARAIWYGCLTATHRARRLARDLGGGEDVTTFGPPALAGPYVAYAFGIATKYMDGATDVTVMNLRTGRSRAARAQPPDGREYAAGVRDVRVNRRGRAAYVVADGTPGRDASVVLLGPAGARVLETAWEPALRNLDLTDDTLTWTDDGRPRAAAVN